ncbi:MAG: protocatechuate 4,5-dioxygenase subunit alpha [Pseudomonadota bacterium]
MAPKKEYDDIPGTIVFDSDQASKGYHLNQFCISLRTQAGRDAFKADPEGYIRTFPMTDDQREAALNQEWNRMLELGGNIYYTSKLAAFHGINFQELAGIMTGMGSKDYRAMMVAGGRSPDGNRYQKEWDEKDG